MSYVTIPILRDFEKISKLFQIVSKDNLGFIAGGFARHCCSPLKEIPQFKDCDVFTSGEDSFQKIKFILQVENNLKIKFENEISVVFKTDDNENWKECPEINLIKPLKENNLLTYGKVLEEVLNNFDFSICRVGVISETECLADENFLFDEKKKKIRILRMESPVACIARLCKYAEKGYKIRVPTIMQCLKEWNERGPDYHSKLFIALEKIYQKKVPKKIMVEGDIFEEFPKSENFEKYKHEIETSEDSIDDDLYHLIKIG